jgi:FkbM family methyltransferase
MLQKIIRKINQTLFKFLNYNNLEILHENILLRLNYGNCDFNTNGEKTTLQYIKNHINSFKPIIFDVGANKGDYCELIQQYIKINTIYAFEPHPQMFLKLKEKFNNNKKIKLFELGFSNKNQTVPLHMAEGKSALSSLHNRNLKHFNISMNKKININVKTIDSFCEENKIDNIDFLKIDIEGEELNAFMGGVKMINNNKIKYIQFEFGGANIDSKTYFRDFWYLLSPKYNLYKITEQGLMPIKKYNENQEIFLMCNYLAELKNDK